MQWGPSGRGLGDFPYLWSGGGVCRFDSRKGQLWKGLEWSRDTAPWFLRPTLVSKVGGMTANGLSRARFAWAVRKTGLLWKTSLALAQLMLSLSMDTQSQRATIKHTYLHTGLREQWKVKKTSFFQFSNAFVPSYLVSRYVIGCPSWNAHGKRASNYIGYFCSSVMTQYTQIFIHFKTAWCPILQ